MNFAGSVALYWVVFIIVLIGALNLAVMGLTNERYNPIKQAVDSLVPNAKWNQWVLHGTYVVIGAAGLGALWLGISTQVKCK